MTTTRSSFSRGASGQRQPHPKPTLMVRVGRGRDSEQFWAYCPICLARPAGWYKDGSPRYRGGLVPVRLKPLPDDPKRDRQGHPLLNYADAQAPCTCWLGQRRREAMEKALRTSSARAWAGKILDYDRFPTDRRWPPGDADDVEIADRRAPDAPPPQEDPDDHISP